MNRQHALGLIGAGLATAAFPAGAGAATAIRLTTLPVDGTALAFYANDLNYFQDAGLDVTISTVPNGAVITAGVTSNSIDIGWSNIISLAAAHSRGLPVMIIGAGGMSVSGSLATQLMVRKDSPIRTAADLNGKTIATTGLADVGQLAPEIWMDKNGGKSSTAKFLEVPFPQIPAALEAGRVDAGWLAEPFIHQAEPFARTLATCFDDVAPRWMLGAWFATPAYISANRAAVDAFRTVITKTAIWANANQDKSAVILAKYSHLDPAVVKSMHRITYATRPEAALIQPAIDLSARYGVIAAPFPAQELLYTGS
jgi:NitT/TauT family transport system substrate-binding protein